MPTTVGSVLLLIAFVIPGFVFHRLIGFSIPTRPRETSYLVLDSLAVSCVNYALLSPLVWLLVRPGFASNHPISAAAGCLVVLFISPLLLAFVATRHIDSPRARWLRRALRIIHPVPKAWDYFFRQGRICWILATLRDGRVVAGLYSTNSFASSYPDEEDLYLETLCKLSPDGEIIGVIPESQGAILRMSDVLLLEFYNSPGGTYG
jgi:hypothetical protein